MAKTLSITTEENAAKIIVDGNEISDVVSYELSENYGGAFLTVKIVVTGAIEVQI